ncbi:MAG: glycoside hydrolase family protein [Pedosphaera sp.]|nr:glycoside hydrolase family protein [Pedosphaera sp.]
MWCVLALAWLPVLAAHRPLLPRPQRVTYGSGVLPVNGLAIRFAMPPNAQDQFAANYLATGLSSLGAKVSVQNGHAAKRTVILNRTGDGADVPVDSEIAGPMSREAYSITVTGNTAEIRAGSSAGLFYGVQTLLQMVEGAGGQTVLPVVELHDWPALAYRGFMMDFSHGQLLRVSEIERQIDLLARFKANQYYFYSEMSIEWEGYEVVTPDGRYTRDEVRHIIEYARQRHIDVVPCMELFGHMHDLFRTEEFADIGLPRYGEEFDPRNPRALQVIDDLLDQTARLFPSPWCHVGFDEPWSLGKIGMTPGKDPFKTFVEVLQHVADRAHQRGKRLMYWADINNGASTLSNHPELLRNLPGGAIAVPWAYESESNYTRYIEPLASNGLATLVAPAVWNWNEIFPDYHRSFTDINGLVAAGKEQKTLGILNTGWTDCGQTLYRQSLPGLAFGAIAGWQSGPVDTNTFFNEYALLTYPPAAAPEVAAALEQLSTVEEMFEDILHNTTQHGFWRDPLDPGLLARLEKCQDSCRQARLLAEQAQEHIRRAMHLAPGDPTLKSLMIAARLFDYLGMKCLYAVEWAGYFRQLKENPDQQLVTLYIGIQMNAQDHGMLADLMDAITGLREPYCEAWLEESTPYRLGTALARWDAESRMWLETSGRVNQLLRSHKKGEPFPSIEVLRAKQ